MGAYRVAIITLSDKGSVGQRVDESGPVLRRLCLERGLVVVSEEILPDEPELLSGRLREICDQRLAELVLTTGGTGLSPRDHTPEATLAVAERLVPGLAEVMRAESLKKTNRAMLSRAVAVTRAQTLIINLPGSPKGARENFEAIAPALGHGLAILTGSTGECAQPS
ncbi:MAG: MogA/MoaB family molybdenum cofactor biosynthesis protein [Deltaproteobacteria bacterium]|jgi:molybdenum cofactor synthesis domain-containing protein|nr:MogA/MoaB family molybdenum cofactor biosynthesis protein [Deltaproteobacteria bacterium]